MMTQRSTKATETHKVRDSIIYLRHPSKPQLFKLLRGGVEKTLRRFGYTEIAKEEYEAGVR